MESRARESCHSPSARSRQVTCSRSPRLDFNETRIERRPSPDLPVALDEFSQGRKAGVFLRALVIEVFVAVDGGQRQLHFPNIREEAEHDPRVGHVAVATLQTRTCHLSIATASAGDGPKCWRSLIGSGNEWLRLLTMVQSPMASPGRPGTSPVQGGPPRLFRLTGGRLYRWQSAGGCPTAVS